MKTYCGFIAIIGKSNVGKSTLINALTGNDISITADRSQTTRSNILGIKTIGNRQAIYIDTPGLSLKKNNKLNNLMNKAAKCSYKDVDLIMFVIESLTWDHEDEAVLQLILKIKNPPKIFLLVNKSDLLKDYNLLLPKIKSLTEQYNFNAVYPISVLTKFNLKLLVKDILHSLPESPHYFNHDTITDRSLNFRIAENIREKLIKNVSQELPYSTHVEILKLEYKHNLIKIHADIWVEKLGQKKIIVGKNGIKLKTIGTQARLALEKLLHTKVFLTLFVQVKPDWTNNSISLKNLYG